MGSFGGAELQTHAVAITSDFYSHEGHNQKSNRCVCVVCGERNLKASSFDLSCGCASNFAFLVVTVASSSVADHKSIV